MTLKIRLRRQGRTNRPFYRVVVTDSRNRRDGRYVETVGWYNPVETEDDKVLSLQGDRIQHWLDNGAQMTEKTEALVGKGAPEVSRWYNEKRLVHRTKAAAKRKERKKTAAKAA